LQALNCLVERFAAWFSHEQHNDPDLLRHDPVLMVLAGCFLSS